MPTSYNAFNDSSHNDRIARYEKLKNKLSNVFQGKTLVRLKSGKTKIVDVHNTQGEGGMFGASRMGFGGSSGMMVNGSKAVSHGTQYGGSGVFASKTQLYNEYERMDRDIIAKALDLYADEITTKDSYGNMVNVKGEDEAAVEIVNNLFYNILQIDSNMFGWCRQFLKYGDAYLKLNIKPDYGIVSAIPISPYMVERAEEQDMDTGYTEVQFKITGQFEPLSDTEMLHFRLTGDVNFLPYGRAVIEESRWAWTAWTLMNDAMLTHRVVRSGDRRLFKIDVGNTPKQLEKQILQQFMDGMKRAPLIDPVTGQYNLRYNEMNQLEDFVMPVRGGQTGTSIETIPGLQWAGTEDVDYIKNMVIASLGIPKRYLNWDESSDVKTSAASDDIRFSHTVERFQRMVCDELKKVAIIHLVAQGFDVEEAMAVEITMASNSTLTEREKYDLMTARLTLAQQAKDSGLMTIEEIWSDIMNYSDTEIEAKKKEIEMSARWTGTIASILQNGGDYPQWFNDKLEAEQKAIEEAQAKQDEANKADADEGEPEPTGDKESSEEDVPEEEPTTPETEEEGSEDTATDGVEDDELDFSAFAPSDEEDTTTEQEEPEADTETEEDDTTATEGEELDFEEFAPSDEVDEKPAVEEIEAPTEDETEGEESELDFNEFIVTDDADAENEADAEPDGNDELDFEEFAPTDDADADVETEIEVEVDDAELDFEEFAPSEEDVEIDDAEEEPDAELDFTDFAPNDNDDNTEEQEQEVEVDVDTAPADETDDTELDFSDFAPQDDTEEDEEPLKDSTKTKPLKVAPSKSNPSTKPTDTRNPLLRTDSDRSKGAGYGQPRHPRGADPLGRKEFKRVSKPPKLRR